MERQVERGSRLLRGVAGRYLRARTEGLLEIRLREFFGLRPYAVRVQKQSPGLFLSEPEGSHPPDRAKSKAPH